ncbi:hypothetical protein BA1DRAFT_04151 [Photorhabdus aegyptia]|uniref:Uncharacterized protein n=1 Tax=Photorhabdus aegyptia TaxID=2805098 RepID=A0A022PEH8_9GAMM|nr:hypothetical protein BA1DRAFT_04151 [Photorhabdus aegyptia]
MSVRVPMRSTGAEQAVVAMKDRNRSRAKGLPHCADSGAATTGDEAGGRTAAKSAKPFPVSKRQVWEAYKRVKANRGAAGIDGQTLTGFDENVTDNLYKPWNRLASGSYMPRRSGVWKFPKLMVECVRSVFLPCRTGSPRRLLSRFSNLCWNRCSIRTRMVTDRENLPTRRLRRRENVAGSLTGWWKWILKASLIISTTHYY